VRWFNATAWYGLFLGQLLARQGHEVLILCLPDTQTLNRVQKSGLAYQTLDLNSNNPFVLARTLSQLKKIIQDFKPHIINCHRGEAFILFGLLAFKYGYSLVRTRGDQRLPKKNLFNLWLHNQVARAVITTNSTMFKHFQNVFKTPSSKLHLVIGGVDESKFYFSPAEREQIRRQYNYLQEDFVVGLVGRFDRVKGQKELIAAISHLYHQENIKNIKLLLIGFDTALKEDTIRQWLKEYQIESITQITGKVDNPRAYICSLDLGVVASLYSETIIRAGLEIMGCGVPLIGTKVGVLPDILSPKALVEPGNHLELAQKIQQCLLDKPFLTTLYQEQREKIQSLYSQNFYEQTLKIYLGTLQ